MMMTEPENQVKSIEGISWKSLSLRIFGGYIAVLIVNQAVPISPFQPHYNLITNILRSSITLFVIYFAGLMTLSLIVILVAKATNENRKKPITLYLNTTFKFFLFVIAVMFFGNYYANKKINVSEATNETVSAIDMPSKTTTLTPAPPSTLKPVLASVTVQDSEGVTVEHFNQHFLSNLEEWIVGMMQKRGREKYTEMGYNPQDYNPKYTSSSVYTIVDGVKLAIIKITIEMRLRSVTIVGIKDKDLYRVNCLREGSHEISVLSGNCGMKVSEVFGINLKL